MMIGKNSENTSSSEMSQFETGDNQKPQECTGLIIPEVICVLNSSEDDVSSSADTEKGNFICDICGKSFEKKRYLDSHGITHTGEKKHGCAHCGKYFARKNELTRHIRSHTGEKRHTCEICGKKFTRAGQLKNHINIHRGVKDYACTYCYRKFTQKNNLAKHLRIHTEKKVSCSQCGKTYRGENRLAYHMLSHSDEMRCTCPRCGKTFTHAHSLDYHQRNYVCIRRYMGIEIIKDKFPHEMDFAELVEYSEKLKATGMVECGSREMQELPSGYLENSTIEEIENAGIDTSEKGSQSESTSETVPAIKVDHGYCPNDEVNAEVEILEDEDGNLDGERNSDDNFAFNIEFVEVEDS